MYNGQVFTYSGCRNNLGSVCIYIPPVSKLSLKMTGEMVKKIRPFLWETKLRCVRRVRTRYVHECLVYVFVLSLSPYGHRNILPRHLPWGKSVVVAGLGWVESVLGMGFNNIFFCQFSTYFGNGSRYYPAITITVEYIFSTVQ